MRNFRQLQSMIEAIGIKFATDEKDFVKGIPIDVIGIHPFNINGVYVIFEVWKIYQQVINLLTHFKVSWNDDGSKLLTVRSAVVLNNRNTVPIVVQVEAPGKQPVILPSIGKVYYFIFNFTTGYLFI